MKSILSKIKLPRPDKLLQKRLIALAYTLVALTATLITLFVYQQHLYVFLLVISFLTFMCLILSLLTLKSGEEAINYGGFANEIIRQSSNAKRIETYKGRIILENDSAKELFTQQNILRFLQEHLAEYRNNNFAYQQLKNAFMNMSSVKVTLALDLSENNEHSSWFQVSLKPIYLKRTDFFEQPFSIKKVKKDIYMYWSFRDITAEHNMEEVFQNERLYMHDFLDYLPAALYIANNEYKIEYCNYAFANKLGKTREDVTGTYLTDYLAENSPIPPQTSAWSGFVHFIGKNGNNIETCIKQDSFRYNNTIKIRAAAITDLPNDQMLHKQLSRAVDEISWLFDFAPIGIVFTNTNGIIQECNSAASGIFNMKNDNIINTNILDLISKNNKHSLTREMEQIVSKEKNMSSLEFVIASSEKSATVHIIPMKRLFADKETIIDGLIFYIIDATEQKKLESQYAQAQKMQALGQLAGGVAHDFNNLLTAIIGFCDLLCQRHSVGDPSYVDLNQIKNNANRAAALVKQLLAFSRKQPLQPKYIDITENFMELIYMLKRIIGENVSLKFHHGTDLGFVKVDPGQFSQVIMNLAVNAKDAMNGKGDLNITTYTKQITTPQQFGEETIKPGNFVVIDVSDTGCGIPEENLVRIFEPFFSTKQNVVGSGTGLGLAMVYGIVRQTGGFIKVSSVVNQGTTFSIHLPRFETNPDIENKEPQKAKNITAADGLPIINVKTENNTTANQKFIFGLNVSAIDRVDAKNPHEGIKILFVEDEDSVRSFAVRALKKKGYEVIGCNSAENALEQLKTNKDFNLLVTDMVMPGMNGVELAKIVKQQIKDIKIILASGYSEEIARNEMAVSDDIEFMAKPFSLGDLTKKIFDVLNKA
ncbi:MAG: response regulator [Alphaproteobacteria bacterium]|nr:response regulator [Alphaproteobacteria bacterium]